MKRNSILFSVLAFLFLITFVSEKILKEDKISQEQELAKILSFKNLGRITKAKTDNFELQFKDDIPYINGQLADEQKVKMFFTDLTLIEVEREISTKTIEDNYYSFFNKNPSKIRFDFEKNYLEFMIGKKLIHDRSFYVEVKTSKEKKYFLAKYQKDLDDIYQENQEESTSHQYNHFLSSINVEADYFLEKTLFKIADSLQGFKVDKIISQAEGKMKEEIDFKNKTTSPAPFKGVNYNIEIYDNYLNQLYDLKVEKIIHNSNKNLLSKHVRTLHLLSGQKEILLDIYEVYNKRSSQFVLLRNSKTLYEIDPKLTPVLTVHYQTFWDRRPLRNNFFTKTSQNKFELIFSDKKFPFSIPFSDHFTVKSLVKAYNVNVESFRTLFALLMNPADFVRPLSVTHWKDSMGLQIDDELLLFKFSDNEIIIHNKKYNIGLHYFVGPKSPLPLKKEDYIQ